MYCQVFLLESQHHSSGATFTEGSDAEDRSFIFLLYPNLSPETSYLSSEGKHNNSSVNANESVDSSDEEECMRTRETSLARENSLQDEVEPVRVPYRSVVIGLLANQVLLQTIGSILVQGSCHIIPSLANVLMQGAEYHTSSCEDLHDPEKCEDKVALPGLLSKLLPRHILCLLSTLELSYVSALEFDARPGLKFLVQKVSSSERAANLYRQAGASWTLRAVALTHLVLHASTSKGFTGNHVKDVLEKQSKLDNTIKRKITDPGADDLQLQQDTSLQTEGDRHNEKPTRPTTLLDSDTMLYIKQLGSCFQELCDMYLDLMTNKDRRKAEIDDVDEHQPLFFLSIKADEFSTEHRKHVDEFSKSMNEFNKKFLKGKCFQEYDEAAAGDNDCGGEMPAEDQGHSDPTAAEGEQESAGTPPGNYVAEGRKPFMLADFVQDYSTDSEDSSLPEFWLADQDSGVASVTGEHGVKYNSYNYFLFIFIKHIKYIYIVNILVCRFQTVELYSASLQMYISNY